MLRHAWVAVLAVGCGGAIRPALHGPAVPVRLTADRKTVALERLDGDHWVPLCTAPCATDVAADEPLRIGGKNVVRSTPFAVRRPVHIHARAGYWDMRAFGTTLVSVGLGAVLFGFLGAMYQSSQGSSWVGGVVVGGVGLGLTAGGIAAWTSNRTTFDVREQTVARLSFVF